jgi:hypothetical protein
VGLKARLFPSAEAQDTTASYPGGWAWFVPVTALFLLVSILVGERSLGPIYLRHSGPDSLLADLAISNQQVASMLTSADTYDRNSPPRMAFTWTNTSRPASSQNHTLQFTNTLIR